jgi:peptidoglycan hydrolase CwlO-like protein
MATALPGAAFGARSSASLAKSLAAKRAEAAKVETRLATSRTELTNALAESADAEMALEAARTDLAVTDATLTSLSGEIEARQAALDSRAVAMYTSGGLDMLEALLSVSTLDDLFSRIDLFSYIQQSDTDLVTTLSVSRGQTEQLQQQQSLREAELIALRQRADARKNTVDLAMAAQKQLMDSLTSDVRKLVKQEEEARAVEAAAAADAGGGGAAPPLPYDPNTLISESAFSASGSMSAAAIQGFLQAQGSYLKSYSARDHAGVTKTAAQMIADAATEWGVSPKVILTTLQKEQSLINGSKPSQRALDWAMGCGKMDSRTLPEYQGFGNQIWGGARALKRNRSYYHPGMSITIDGAAVYPTNAATLTLYRYTPHFHGNTLFWRLYWRYFGDPAK